MQFLQQPVTIDTDGETLASVIAQIVRGAEHYQVRKQGPLLILYPTHPAQPINRILKFNLGPMKYAGTSMTDLNIQLFEYVQAASGCRGEGFSGGYVRFPLVVPPFSLSSATFDQVIEKVALAPEPTMWVVAPDDGKRGCIEGDSSYWEAGLYNNTPSASYPPLRASVGSDFVK